VRRHKRRKILAQPTTRMAASRIRILQGHPDPAGGRRERWLATLAQFGRRGA
jgi:hypothetical protein